MSTDGKTLADVASEMSRRQATHLDEGLAALLRAGVHANDLEVVSETFSRSDEPFVIHQRVYVRAREEAWGARIRQEERERIAALLEDGGAIGLKLYDGDDVAAWLRAGAK